MQDERRDLSDAELLRRAPRDADAFGDFYDRHIDAVLAFFVRRTLDAQTAYDLAAETFARAFIGSGSFRDRGAPAAAWLFAIARNELATALRRERVEQRSRRKLGMERVDLDDANLERIEQLADVEALREQLEEAMGRLSPSIADAVRLRVADELPYAEIARRLGCSEGAARVRVARGLERLHCTLEAP